jgi:hypothetical protein
MTYHIMSSDSLPSPHYSMTSPQYAGPPLNFNYGNVARLMNAVRQGNTNTARTLIEDGTNVDSVSWTGETPLMTAAIGGKTATVRMLLEKGATVYPGMLHLVAGGPDLALVRLFVEHGHDDVNLRDFLHQTPLHRAAMYGRAATAKYLIEHGARIHAKDIEGKTALHIAARYEFPKTVRVLLDAGARTNVKDRSGRTPLGTDTTDKIVQMMLLHDDVQPRRLHDQANGVDVTTLNKVPLRDARVILGDTVNGRIRHVFHKDTIERMRRFSDGMNTHPITRRPFEPNNVVPLQVALHKNEHPLYNRLRHTTNAGTLRNANAIVISNSNSRNSGSSRSSSTIRPVRKRRRS